jgi:hypothetical protein
MPSISCYAVPHNLLKSLVPVLLKAPGMETVLLQCALGINRLEPVVGLNTVFLKALYWSAVTFRNKVMGKGIG